MEEKELELWESFCLAKKEEDFIHSQIVGVFEKNPDRREAIPKIISEYSNYMKKAILKSRISFSGWLMVATATTATATATRENCS